MKLTVEKDPHHIGEYSIIIDDHCARRDAPVKMVGRLVGYEIANVGGAKYARLFAASPGLLAATKALTAVINDLRADKGVSDATIDAAMALAQSAIAATKPKPRRATPSRHRAKLKERSI